MNIEDLPQQKEAVGVADCHRLAKSLLNPLMQACRMDALLDKLDGKTGFHMAEKRAEEMPWNSKRHYNDTINFKETHEHYPIALKNQLPGVESFITRVILCNSTFKDAK